MFRKLLLLTILFAGGRTMAQVSITPLPDAKKKEAGIDYTKIGSPMPPLRLMRYLDTAQKAQADAATEHSSKRKRKKHGVTAEPTPASQKFVTNDDLDNNANLFVMLFNPNCSHCEDETQLLEKNIFLFTRSKIVLMANPVMWEYLPNFSRAFHLPEYSTITVGADSAGFIDKLFLYTALPQINVYSKDRKLLKIFSGEAPIDSLKPYIE